MGIKRNDKKLLLGFTTLGGIFFIFVLVLVSGMTQLQKDMVDLNIQNHNMNIRIKDLENKKVTETFSDTLPKQIVVENE